MSDKTISNNIGPYSWAVNYDDVPAATKLVQLQRMAKLLNIDPNNLAFIWKGDTLRLRLLDRGVTPVCESQHVDLTHEINGNHVFVKAAFKIKELRAEPFTAEHMEYIKIKDAPDEEFNMSLSQVRRKAVLFLIGYGGLWFRREEEAGKPRIYLDFLSQKAADESLRQKSTKKLNDMTPTETFATYQKLIDEAKTTLELENIESSLAENGKARKIMLAARDGKEMVNVLRNSWEIKYAKLSSLTVVK